MDIPLVHWAGTAEGGATKVGRLVQQCGCSGRAGKGRGNLLPNYFNSIHFAIGPVLASSVVRLSLCVCGCMGVCMRVCIEVCV